MTFPSFWTSSRHSLTSQQAYAPLGAFVISCQYGGPLGQMCATPLKIFQMCSTPPRNTSDVQHITSKYFRCAAQHPEIFQMCSTPRRNISDVQHTTWEYFERAAHQAWQYVQALAVQQPHTVCDTAAVVYTGSECCSVIPGLLITFKSLWFTCYTGHTVWYAIDLCITNKQPHVPGGGGYGASYHGRQGTYTIHESRARFTCWACSTTIHYTSKSASLCMLGV